MMLISIIFEKSAPHSLNLIVVTPSSQTTAIGIYYRSSIFEKAEVRNKVVVYAQYKSDINGFMMP